MTNVTAATTKSVADTSSGGMLARANAQDSDGGGFARALGDAEDDGAASPAPAEAGDQAQTASAGDANPGATRFSALNGLASQLQLGTNVPALQSGTQPSQAAQALLDAQAASLSPLAGQQPGLPGTEQLLPQVIQQNNQGIAAPTDPSTLTGEEAASATLDLAKLTAAISGVKRPAAAPAETGKDQDDTSSTSDAAAGAQSDAAASAAAGQVSASASAQVLLQLMASASAIAAQETAGNGSSAGDQPVSGVVAGNSEALQMPTTSDDADTTVDPLSAGADAAPAPDAKAFRFQKAGDAAVAVSLSLTKGDNGAELQESAGDAQKPEIVTVLDSRRYLGFGMGSNASNLLSAASSDREWSAAMHPSASLSNAASASSTGNVVNTLKLQLTPDHLGTVTANMRLQGDELSIHLTVHNAAAYRELSDDSRPMLEALRAQGFNVDQVTVALSSSSDPNSNSSSGQSPANSNPQAQQQQLQRDGEARQQAQGQGGASDRSDRSDRNDPENLNETSVQAPVRGGANAGSLYL